MGGNRMGAIRQAEAMVFTLVSWLHGRGAIEVRRQEMKNRLRECPLCTNGQHANRR